MKTTYKSCQALLLVLGAIFALSSAIAGDNKQTVLEKSPWKPGDPITFADGLVTFDIEERLRYEFRDNNFDFNSANDAITDGSFLLQRFRLGIKVKPTDWLTLYSQGQSSFEIGKRSGPPGAFGAEGDDYMDLYQAYLQIGNPKSFPLEAKLGRQTLNYGEQRLIGSFDWNNLGRTFDAALIRWESGDYRVDTFASSVVLVREDKINASDLFNWSNSDREMVFSGLYATTKAIPAHTLDAYALWLLQDQGNVTNFEPLLSLRPAGSQGGNPNLSSNYGTFGLRLNSDPKKLGGFEYDVEAAFQVGELAGLDLAAAALHTGVGYNFYSLPWKPRLYAQYNYATGDGNPNDGRSTTFQNLFPTNHKFYGYMDLFSWQNLHNPSLTLQLKPLEVLTLAVDYHLFWLATTNDAWYRANGLTRARPITPSAGSFVGSELDLSATWNVTKWASLHGGYSVFFPGDYVRDTGPADVANFVYLQAQFKF
jgi:hypothetical protein